MDEGPGVASDLTDESFETAIVEGPWFDFGDQFHGHVERAGTAPLLEGQMPAWLSAAGSFEGREAAFQEGADSSDLAQGRGARPGVPVGSNRAGVHGLVEVRRTKIRAGSRLIPRGRLEGLNYQLMDLFFQGAIVGNSSLTFPSLCGGQSFGGAFSFAEAGPAVIGAVEFGRFGLAGAIGFAAGAAGGGEAAREEWEGDVESDLFWLHMS